MLGPFATTSRLTPIQQMSLVVLSRAACASMSTTSTTTTTRDRGDRYGPMEWAQLVNFGLMLADTVWNWITQITAYSHASSLNMNIQWSVQDSKYKTKSVKLPSSNYLETNTIQFWWTYQSSKLLSKDAEDIANHVCGYLNWDWIFMRGRLLSTLHHKYMCYCRMLLMLMTVLISNHPCWQ